jgi:hypothetical protein
MLCFHDIELYTLRIPFLRGDHARLPHWCCGDGRIAFLGIIARRNLMGFCRRIYFPVVMLFFTFILFPSKFAGSQAARGTISGEVRDPSAAVIPDAKITLTEIRTNQEYSAKTDESGFYAIINLAPGSYTLAAQAKDFKRFVQEGIQLATGESIRVDPTLMVGSPSENVTVTSDAPLLRSESGSLGQVVSNRSIIELPLNGRNFLGLVGLAAGVANPPGGSTTPRINGGRPRTNEYLYDGISVLQPEPGQVALYPIMDAIQEFKLEVNSPSAEFGRFNGGVVNLTTKSGTNQFHGSLFEFFRNEVLNARNLFAPATVANPKKPVFRRNQFGGVLGGPIIKGKTFFFVDYQGTRQLVNRVRTSTVPTLLQRQGIFTEAINKVVPAVYDPTTTVAKAGGGYTRTQFLNSTLTYMDPVAVALLNRFPLPTKSGTSNNYTRNGNEPDNLDQFDVRIDHRFSMRDSIFGRYSYAIDKSSPVTPLPDGSGSITSGFIGVNSTLGQSLASEYIHSFSDRTTNELRVGYTRRAITQAGTELDSPPSQTLSIPGIPSNAAFSNILPTFTINGVQQLGSPSNASLNSRTDVTEIVDMVSFLHGRHTIKAGLDFRWERLDIIQPPQPTGVFNFSTVGSDLPGVSGTGNALAGFLLGQVNTFSIDLQQKVIRPRAHIQEYFVQDDWKATRNLTVNAGLRYTLNFPSTEVDNQGAVFNLVTQQLDYLGQNGFPDSARELHKANFGPRLGLAYRMTEKTVLRSGYALVFIEMAGITTPFINPQFPYIQTATNRTLDNVNPAFILSQGPSVPSRSLTPDAGLGQGVYTVDRHLGSGYMQQWNLTIEREIAKNFIFEIAYAGNKITHLGIPDTNINQLTVDQLQAGNSLTKSVANPYYGTIPRQSSLGNPTISAAQLLKPYPRFTTVSFFRNNVGNSHYDSLQAKLERRASKGIAFLISYTRSKLLDDASSVFSSSIYTGPAVTNYPVADSFNRRLERDVSSGDMPNVFSGSVTYDLPLGPGHGLGNSGLVGMLIGGWKVGAIVSIQSGLPLAVTQATNNNAFAGFSVQRPNRVGNPVLDDPTTAMWFDTSAFQAAPQFTLGNASRNPVRGPGYWNMDLALIKQTRLQEAVNMEFRAECFNLTNTPPLGSPAVVLGNAGFGTITSAGDPRVIQFALKVSF